MIYYIKISIALKKTGKIFKKVLTAFYKDDILIPVVAKHLIMKH